MACAQQSAKEYLRNTRKDLVTGMKNLPLIIESLYQQNVFSVYEVDDLEAERTKLRKARYILDRVINKGDEASYTLLKILDVTKKRTLDPGLHSWISYFPFKEDHTVPSYSFGIPGSSVQTSSEVLETESHSQNTGILQVQAMQQMTEDKQVIWRNESSTIHSTKIKELLREPNIKNIDSLYFYKDEKYMIGSGGDGTQVYIGMRKDGIEVAIKIITKNPKNIKDFENELKLLLDLNLESPYIVRYMFFAEDKDFYYLANQLCDYDLEKYMENLRQPEQKDRKETALRKIVKEMLLGLQVLHRAGVIHRDIKPGNVLIDQLERARLADFGISRKLEEGISRVYTTRAGTQGWEATEILQQFEQGNTELKAHYKQSSDIQVAGMLTYYILSDGKHPFGDGISRGVKILEGKRIRDDVKDSTAMDLIDWMINKDQSERPTVDKALDHPYFWDDKRLWSFYYLAIYPELSVCISSDPP